MTFQSINPANGELLREYPESTTEEVTRILRAARVAFCAWRRTTFGERAGPMRRAGELLRERKDALGRLMALEMGKPLAQGRAEAEKCASVCDYYAGRAAGFLAPEEVATDASKSYVSFEPLGVVLAVMPWNFPLWQVFRFVAPGLMAGNAGLLKHSSNVSGCALAMLSLKILSAVASTGAPDFAFRSGFPACGSERNPFLTLTVRSGRPETTTCNFLNFADFCSEFCGRHASR